MKKKTEKHLYQKIHLALDIKAFNEQVYDLREVSAEMDYVILMQLIWFNAVNKYFCCLFYHSL